MTDVFGIDLEVDASGIGRGKKGLDDLAKSGDKVDKSLSKVDKTLIVTKKSLGGATISAEEFAKALEMDAKEFNATQKGIVTALNNSSKKIQSASLAVDRFQQDQKILGYSISNNGKVLDKQGVEVIKLTRRWQDLNSRLTTSKAQFDAAQKSALMLGSATGKVNGGFKLMKGSAQQAGYQIGDFAVQMQMGTPFLTAFGQQAGQLAMILGPSGAVIGAIISISAAIGGIFVKSMNAAAKESEILSKSISEITANLEELERIELFGRVGDIEDTIKNTRIELQGLGTDLIGELSKGLEGGQRELLKYLEGNTYEDVLSAIDKAMAKAVSGGTKRSLADLKNSLLNVNEIESEGFKNKNKINAVMAKISEKNRLIAELEKAQLDIQSRINDIGDKNISNIEKEKLYRETLNQNLTDAIAREKLKASEIAKGLRERKKELEILQRIEDSSKSIVLSEMSARDAAIAKGRAQQEVLKNQRLSAAESAISSAMQSGKTELEIENERYKESLKLIQEYAEEKGWLDAKIKSTELLLAQEHQDKLLAIEQKGTTKRTQNSMNMFEAINTGVGIFNNIQDAMDAKQLAQLERDLSNKENFSEAEIALKEKTAKRLFDKQKQGDLASIISSTSVGVMGQLAQGNWAGAALVGTAGVAQYAKANAAEYGGSSAPSGGNFSEPAPSIQNNTNNSGGNIFNISVEGGGGDALTEQKLIDAIKKGLVLFDGNTEQGAILR